MIEKSEEVFKKLINLLKQKIDKYKEKSSIKEEVEYSIAILNEIINILSDKDYKNMEENVFMISIMLDKSVLFSEKEIENIIDELTNNLVCITSVKHDDEYEERKLNAISKVDAILKLMVNTYKKQLDIYNDSRQYIYDNKAEIKKIHMIVKSYEKQLVITEDQIKDIRQYIDNNDFDYDEKLKIMEYIRYHNHNIDPNKYLFDSGILDLAEERILRFESDKHYKYKDKNKNYISSLYSSLQSPLGEISLNVLPSILEYEHDLEEYCYIMEQLINKFIDDIDVLKEQILGEDLYDIIEDVITRVYIVAEYNDLKQKIGLLMNKYKMEIYRYEEKNKLNKCEDVNEIFYLSKTGGRESYVESDITDFPEEYLETVKYLINGFKKDKLVSSIENKMIGKTHNLFKGHGELRSDQVRIVYKHLDHNKYLIKGMFVKKADNSIPDYKNICSRTTVDVSTNEKYLAQKEYSKEVETNLYNYIDKNKRIGIR